MGVVLKDILNQNLLGKSIETRIGLKKQKNNRLENCYKNAAKKKGTKNPEHGKLIFKNYVSKNKEIILQIWELRKTGPNRRQISMQLGISWDRVNLAINKKQDIENYYDSKTI